MGRQVEFIPSPKTTMAPPAPLSFIVQIELADHQSFLRIMKMIAMAATMIPNSQAQYFARKPCSSTGAIGASTIAGAGAATGSATGAGVGAGAGAGSATGAGSTGFGAAFATFLFFFFTTGLGASS
ncbi:MAG TPA: hypothetical protein DCK83_04000 [Gallionellaceae bacterium]|nr:hypothetical protein [Gallionellaceae bacterium]